MDEQTKLMIKYASLEIILDAYVETESISRLLIKKGIISELELIDQRKKILCDDVSAVKMQEDLKEVTNKLEAYYDE